MGKEVTSRKWQLTINNPLDYHWKLKAAICLINRPTLTKKLRQQSYWSPQGKCVNFSLKLFFFSESGAERER